MSQFVILLVLFTLALIAVYGFFKFVAWIYGISVKTAEMGEVTSAKSAVAGAPTSGGSKEVEVDIGPITVEEPEIEDPDAIQISGPIPIDDDIAHNQTQPIPKVGSAKLGPKKETIVVQDHVMASFYQKLFDMKSYDLRGTIRKRVLKRYGDTDADGRVDSCISGMKDFESYVPYDTYTFRPAWGEHIFFTVPCYQQGKTALETNLEVGSFLVLLPYTFITKVVVIRFQGSTGKEEKQAVLEGGILRIRDTSGVQSPHREIPLSMFEPLNPFDSDPRVFFCMLDETLFMPNHYVEIAMCFPRGLGSMGLVPVRIELPGIRFKAPFLE